MLWRPYIIVPYSSNGATSGRVDTEMARLPVILVYVLVILLRLMGYI
jgi:hypothetical protein